MPILTVNGPLTRDEISGVVLAHEHLAIDLTTPNDPAAVVSDHDQVLAELVAAREQHGLSLVVDLTCRGMGRDVVLAHAIAEQAGIHLVVATGYYYERFHPPGELDVDSEAVAERLLEEIEHGIDSTGIRPGVLGEIGSSGPIASAAERTSLIAAAIAARRSGLSVGTHAHLGQGGLEQLELLTGAGLDPRHICIGHQDLLDDPSQHRTIATSGAYVGFDTIGKESYQSDDVRLRMLLGLIEDGFERQLLLSNDLSRDAYLETHGGPGLGHVLGPFRDRLHDAGVDETTLELLYRVNALNWLEGA